MSLFYKQAWLNIGQKYVKLLEAMGDEISAVKLYKTGFNGTVFSKTVTPKRWESKSGYDVQVISMKDKSDKDLDQMQKLNAVKSFMPTNRILNTIIQNKLLNIGGLTPDEIKTIMEEEAKAATLMTPTGLTPPVPGASPITLPNMPSPPKQPEPRNMIPTGAIPVSA